MGFGVRFLFMAFLPMINAQLILNIDDGCLVTPKYGPPGHGHARRPPCINYEVLQPELINLNNSLPLSLAELGLSDVLTDVDELQDADLIQFQGPIGPIGSGGARRRRRMASHWSRVGRVTNLVYNVSHMVTVDVEDGEQFFAFASPDLDSLSPDDNLEGPLRNLTEDVEGFPMHYPATTTEGMPFLVQDFHDLLDSFNCTNSGPNCGLTRGRDSVVHLDENWSIVQRLALEYEPGGMRRAIRFKILIVALRGFRIFIQLFIF